jgi:hypothetical protein
MAIINKNDLKQLSNSTYIDNTQGLIRPQDVRFFNDELIDSLVDESGYAIDSASWNNDIQAAFDAINILNSDTAYYVLNSQTSSMSVASASYVDLRGDNVTINYGNGWIEITGSESNAQVIVSDTAPNNYSYPSGTLWFSSISTAMYVNYCSDPLNCTWIGVSAAGPVISASYAGTASIAYSASYSATASYFITSSVTSASIAQTAQTASYFLTSSVTSASRAEVAGYALEFYTASVTNATNAIYAASASWIDIVGKGIEINNYFGQYQLTASVDGGASVQVSDLPPTGTLDSGSLWFNSLNGAMYVWYIDADSSQWVSVNMVGPVATASLALNALTASYINVTGSNIGIKWNGSQLQLTGSEGGKVIVSDTAPLAPEEGQQWFNSINTNMYIYYGGAWIGVAGAGPVVSSSYSFTSSHALFANTASFALQGGNQNLQSVTTFGNSTSQSIDIRDRLIVNVTGSGTFTQGLDVEATGNFAHAQGYDTRALDEYAHAEGVSTIAQGRGSHSEGANTEANGDYSHSEGEGTNANGQGSHTEGYESVTTGRGAHAEGTFTLAEGNYSHAEGETTWAYGRSSHAQGLGTVAQGIASNTEGRYTNAAADYQSVVGQWNIPLSSTDTQGYFIVGDGNGLLGDANRYHNLITAGDGIVSISGSLNVEGAISGIISGSISNANTASYALTASHVLGGVASASYANTSSYADTALLAQTASYFLTSSVTSASFALTASYVATASHINVVGNNITVNWNGSQLQLSASITELDTLQSVTTRGNHTSQSIVITGSLSQGMSNRTIGLNSHAEGMLSTAAGNYSHAEGGVTFAFGTFAHTEGNQTTATSYAHAEGNSTKALGAYSHTEGQSTTTTANIAHAEGQSTVANGVASHAEGLSTVANNAQAHAEGFSTLAQGITSHAEGDRTTAIGNNSHAEGTLTTAIGNGAHAEGGRSNLPNFAGGRALADSSHAEGRETTALGLGSHAEGYGTITAGDYQHAQGKFNIPVGTSGAFVVGDGTSDVLRKNLITAADSKVNISGSLSVNNKLDITGSIGLQTTVGGAPPPLAIGSIPIEINGTIYYLALHQAP